MDEPEIRSYMRRILLGLEYLHENGLTLFFTYDRQGHGEASLAQIWVRRPHLWPRKRAPNVSDLEARVFALESLDMELELPWRAPA